MKLKLLILLAFSSVGFTSIQSDKVCMYNSSPVNHWISRNQNTIETNYIFTNSDTASIQKVVIKINGFTYNGNDAVYIDTLKKIESIVFFKNDNTYCRDVSYEIRLKRGRKEIDLKEFRDSISLNSFNIRRWLRKRKARALDRLEVIFKQSCQKKDNSWRPAIVLPLK